MCWNSNNDDKLKGKILNPNTGTIEMSGPCLGTYSYSSGEVREWLMEGGGGVRSVPWGGGGKGLLDKGGPCSRGRGGGAAFVRNFHVSGACYGTYSYSGEVRWVYFTFGPVAAWCCCLSVMPCLCKLHVRVVG